MTVKREPVTVEGKTWYPTTIAAEMTYYSTHTLQDWAIEWSGINSIVTANNGARFIRIPRTETDRRVPIYWDIDSLKCLSGKGDDHER